MIYSPILTLPFWGGMICLVLEVVFIAFRVPFSSFPLFVIGFFLIAYVPGRLIIQWSKLTITPLERLTLELGTGYVLTTLIYFICRSLKIELVYFLIIGVVVVYYFYSLFEKEAPWPAIEFKWDWFSFAFLVVLALVLLSYGYLNFSSWVFNEDGTMSIGMLVDRDVAFHISLLQELSFDFPPQYPYAGNFPLAYHFFPDLFASIFVRWGNLAAYDLVVRFMPVFHFTLLFLGTFILTRKLTDERWVSLAAVFLINFMGNMGFIFKLGGQSLDYHWEEYFAHLFKIMNINPLQVALTLIILGMFCLVSFYENGKNNKFLLLAAGFLGLLANYKVFAAFQVMLGIGFAALVHWLRKKDMSLIYLGLTTGVIVSLSVFTIWNNSPYHGKFIAFKPWYLVHFTKTMRLSPAEQFSFTYEKFRRLMFATDLKNFVRYFLGYGLFYLLGCLWLRVIGMKKWAADLLGFEEKPAATVLAYTILVGVIFSLLFTRPPEDFNVIFSLELSLYLMSIYAAIGLFRLIEKSKTATKVTLVTLFIFLSIPTTLNLLLNKPEQIMVPRQFVRLGKYIKDNLPPGSIIAHSYKAPLYMLLPALGGTRSMAELVFPIENLLGKETTIRLRKDNLKIFKTKDSKELKNIVRNHRLDYVIEDQQDTIQCSKKGIMNEIYRRDGYVINKVIKF